MTAAVLIPVVVVAASVALMALVLVRAEIRRGAFLGAGLCLLVLGSSSNVPGAVADAVILASGACLVVSLSSGPGGRRGLRHPIVGLGALLFTLSAAVTLFEQPYAMALVLRISGLCLLTAIATARLSRADLRVVAVILVSTACVEVVLAVLEVAIVKNSLPWGRRVVEGREHFGNVNRMLGGSVERAEGSLGHAIPFGLLMTVAFVLTLFQRPFGRWWLNSLALAALVVGIVLSGSRSAVLGVALALLYTVFASRATGRAIRVAFVAACALGTGIALRDDIRTAVAETAETGSVTNRIGALDSIPALLARPGPDAWFGNGWGSEHTLYDQGLFLQNGFFIVDNQIVTTLATTGILGAGLLMALVAVSFITGGPQRRALVLIMVVMMFSFDFLGWNAIGPLFFVCLAWPGDGGDSPPHRRMRRTSATRVHPW